MNTDEEQNEEEMETEAESDSLDAQVNETYDPGLYKTNPVKAIREKCKDCMSNQTKEIRLCPVKDCALYPFRFGKNPFYAKRELTEEQREAQRAKMAKARAARVKK